MILGFQYSSVQKGIPVEYLVIAGGGAGGQALSNAYNGGGGGAGGFRTGTMLTALATATPVSVGGAGATNATNGGNSIFSTITSTGGGRGFGQASAAQNGGSGGGGSSAGSSFGISSPVTDPVQGFRGGTGNNTGQPGGAGGGAGAVGGDAIPGSNTGGAGGAGRASSITGTSVTYAGGGSGGGQFTQAGGSGGGGAGGINGNPGSPGTFYGSAGGGGNGINSTVGGVGFQGVVILKYPDTHTMTIGAGLTGSTAASGGFKVTTITAGTGNITLAVNPPEPPLQTALNTYPGRAGLIGQYFNGDWRSTISTGNIGTLPLSAPTTYTSISYGTRGDFYGFIAIGYFKPPTTGTYTFYTSSDDGSGVWVGDIAAASSGRTTANATLNNALGAGQGDTKRSGTISLTGGIWYPIRIVHEEGGGGDNLTFSWAGPGIAETTSLSTYFKAPMDLSGSNLNTYYPS